ncbi:uncharacterized protein LOC119120385 [Syngnathus acus]|uniref:uncharacterized protein LOC119120385 n=1 Tax=Syngnathus acus TaxID=161584 RepID=UPI001885F1CC|nr:uncharacterized protein LOC119120385 [Syngnathus acus]
MATSLFLAIFLGLWAIVYSGLVHSVTQNPIKSEEDVLREAVTDGFLVEYFVPPSLESEPLEEKLSPQEINQTSSGSGDGRNRTLLKEMIEGGTSGDGFFQPKDEDYSTTSERALPSSSSSTTLSLPSGWTSSSQTNATQSSNMTEPSVPSPTVDFESFYSGSGNSEIQEQYPTRKPSMTHSPPFITIEQGTSGEEDLESGSGFGIPKKIGKKGRLLEFPSVQGGEFYHIPGSNNPPTTEQHKGHVTPDWIIILGFVVGVAALLMLCLAIATRDKWNGPRQASRPQIEVDSSQHQKSENEAFLQKDTPKENGKAAEYTVIPLDELPVK